MLSYVRRAFDQASLWGSRVAAGRPVVVAAIACALAACAWSAAAYAAWFGWEVTTHLPGRSQVAEIGDMARATTLLDVHDRPVFTIFKEQRIDVPLSQVSANLIRAVISVEDQRFYEHRGVDLVRVAAALMANVRSGRRAQGGSTITQQLARQSFLSRDKTLRRKLKEVLLAADIEHSYSKDEILRLYLNKVYFGDGLYGVEAASLGYFGTHASELSVDQAALLAGLIQSPSAYAPTANLARAIARRNIVLQTMLDSGVIDRATHDRARGAPVHLRNALRRDELFGLYFKEQVRRELVDRFGWERVSEGGLRVYTTIDPDLQHETEKIVESSLDGIEARRSYKHTPRAMMTPPAEDQTPDYLQAAVVVLDPATGEVRALVGGRSFKESRFNRAMQAKRQPGSAFKPFVFAAALENGYSPATLLTGLDDPVLTPQGEWMPEDEHSGATEMTLRTALRSSSNRAAVRLLTSVGIVRTVNQVKLMNVGSVPSVPSLALGSGEVTLLSMTAAYAAFAHGGVVNKPTLIRRVEDSDGVVLVRYTPQPQRAVSETSAFLMASMLSDVINAGTAYRARTAGFTLPAAGKTGTTNDYKDAWFVGFTPRIVAGVWIGFDQPQTIIANGYAGELAVPLWAAVMKRATAGDKARWFDRPRDVTAVNVCRMSGRLPAGGCDHVEVTNDDGATEVRSMIYTEYFRRGTEPTTLCDLHQSPNFFEQLAGVFGKDVTPNPVRSTDAGLPAHGTPQAQQEEAVAATAGETEADQAGVEQPKKKKRGFWSRLFGRGRDADKDDRKKESEENDRKKPDSQ
jgi:penicillin-binding protein 1A